jgi:hypothetical protein
VFHLPFVSLYMPVFRLAEHSACHLLARWFAEPISLTLKMEAICSSETSVETQQTARRHIPGDDTLHVYNLSKIIHHSCTSFVYYLEQNFFQFDLVLSDMFVNVFIYIIN